MDLIETPTVQLVQERTESNFQEQFDAALVEVERTEVVTKAREAHEALAKRQTGLKATRDFLNARGKQLGDGLFLAQRDFEKRIIDQCMDGASAPDVGSAVDQIYRAKTEALAVTNVIERLVVYLIPENQIEVLGSHSHLLSARGRELERIANVRFAKTAEMLQAAVGFEGAISLDTRGTFTGMLIYHASALKAEAAEVSRNAEECRRKQVETVRHYNSDVAAPLRKGMMNIWT